MKNENAGKISSKEWTTILLRGNLLSSFQAVHIWKENQARLSWFFSLFMQDQNKRFGSLEKDIPGKLSHDFCVGRDDRREKSETKSYKTKTIVIMVQWLWS